MKRSLFAAALLAPALALATGKHPPKPTPTPAPAPAPKGKNGDAGAIALGSVLVFGVGWAIYSSRSKDNDVRSDAAQPSDEKRVDLRPIEGGAVLSFTWNH